MPVIWRLFLGGIDLALPKVFEKLVQRLARLDERELLLLSGHLGLIGARRSGKGSSGDGMRGTNQSCDTIIPLSPRTGHGNLTDRHLPGRPAVAPESKN